MFADKKIKGKRVYLKLLKAGDVTASYVNWMNDPEITKFLESRWEHYTTDKIRHYVKNTNSDKHNLLFGIFLKINDRHIGNIKIGNINPTHGFADLGLVIGEKDLWGKGYGTEAIILATEVAFKKIKLNKLIAGIYANNLGSYKAFIKADYRKAGVLKKHRIYENAYVDEIIVEKRRSL